MRQVVSAAPIAAVMLLAAAVSSHAGLDENNVGEWEVLDTTYEDSSNPVWTEGAVQTDSALSEILSPNEARLSWQAVEGKNELGTSIEEFGLDLSSEDPFSAYFCYTLEDGAAASGGAPRLFVEVDGTYYNTWDHGDPSGLDTCGEYEGWGWLDLPAGTVGHVGLVYDNSVEGSVLVTNPTIANVGVLFEGDPEEEPEVAPEITDAPSSVVAGAEVSVSGTGFLPGEAVSGVLNSDPVDLGVVTADDEGAVTFAFTIPSDIAPGTHTVTLTGLESQATASVSIEITASSADTDGDTSDSDGDEGDKAVKDDDAPQGYNPGLSSNTGHGSDHLVELWIIAGVLGTAAALTTIVADRRRPAVARE